MARDTMNRLGIIGLSVCLLLSAAIVMASHPGHDEPGKPFVVAEFPDPTADVTLLPAIETGAISLRSGLPIVRLLPA